MSRGRRLTLAPSVRRALRSPGSAELDDGAGDIEGDEDRRCKEGREALSRAVALAAEATVTKFPERLGRGIRIVERGTLIEKGFSTVETKLIHVPGKWNVAPYHVPGDYGGGMPTAEAGSWEPVCRRASYTGTSYPIQVLGARRR
jgi:hypothetical protein